MVSLEAELAGITVPRHTRVFLMDADALHSPSGGEAKKRHQGSTGPLSRKLLPLQGLPGDVTYWYGYMHTCAG
jgi:hypothetical protein